MNKAVWQEFKYIKIPDRRLLSGLLYVNVINHNDNDGHDDFIQQLYDIEAGAGSGSVSNNLKYSDPFTNSNGTPTFGAFKDRGRDGMRHSFADYDCFVFHVAGGMSLSGGISLPDSGHFTSFQGGPALLAGGYVTENTGRYYWIDTSVQCSSADINATWYAATDNVSNPLGDNCCHFIKSHLVSRINNASGHGLNQTGGSDPYFYKSRPVQRQTYTSVGTGASIQNPADPATIVNQYVLSDGIYSTEEADGTALGPDSLATVGDGLGGSGDTNEDYYGIDEHERDAGETWNGVSDYSDEGNTYFSPVDTVKIYGKHRLVFDNHYKVVGGSTKNYIFSWSGQNGAHVTDWWDLVIDIGLRGNNPSGSSSHGDSTKSLVKPQININWQPFGETAEFSISDTAHTS